MNNPLFLTILFFGLLLIILVLTIQNLNLKSELEKETIILNSARKLSRKMYELGDREAFFKETWEILKKITDADEFTYFKFDGVDTLIPEYVEGIYREQILKTRLKMGEGFSGKVAVERSSKILNNANKSSIAKHVPNTPNEDSALLAVPVIFGNDLYGVILLTKLGGKAFKQEELKITELFVNLSSAFVAGNTLISTIKNGFIDLLKTLITAVELKDTYTAGHSLRVSKISEIIAKSMQLPTDEITKCRLGGLLHDIGKIGIKEEILKNGDPLTLEMREEVIRHPELGYKLISKLKLLGNVSETILYHHEWYNGQGYPRGLKDGEIPISARIVHLADAIDAMTSGRAHSKRRTLDEAIVEIKRFKGVQFDPKVVDAALSVWEEIESVIKSNITETILEDEFEFKVL